MRAGTHEMTGSVDGWVQFAGQTTWQPARFSIADPGSGHRLLVQRERSPDPSTIDLRDVTALEELLGAPSGYQHVEIAVERLPFAQAVWPPAFTDLVVSSLHTTLEPVVDLVPSRRRAGAGLIGALALVGCGALLVGALGLRSDGPDTPVETAVLTQTTLRGPQTTTTTAPPALEAPPADCTLPEPTAATTIVVAGDECAPS